MIRHRLAYIDQATYLSCKASGRDQLVQYVWVYRNPVDMEALRRFHRDFGYGLAGRLIEPSVLPFGRHRWVAATGPAAPLDVAAVRPPSELGAWIEERSQRPIDAVHGPGWQLGVLPMSDGSSAVTLVMSHCLLDGGGSLRTLVDAVNGRRCELGYELPGSRKRLAALVSDSRQVARDLPEFGRTVAKAVRFAHRRRREVSSSRAGRQPAVPAADGPVVVPAVSAVVAAADWDARAESLGGTSYSLLAGFAAQLGCYLGRARDADDAVTLLIAITDRGGEDDLRGNAMKIATATVDPASVTTDLAATRTAVREALAAVRDVPDETHALLPLTPFVPKRAVRRTADVVFGDLPVSCSNIGEVPCDIACPDGTEAEYVLFRPIDQNVTRSALERAGGQLAVAAGRVVGTVSIGVVGYQVGAANSREWLAEKVIQTLTDFELKGTII
jgi:hypothetical protein